MRIQLAWSTSTDFRTISRASCSGAPCPNAQRARHAPIGNTSRILVTTARTAGKLQGLFPRRGDIRHRQVPVGEQDLETALFLTLVSRLVRPELLDHTLFVGIGSGGERGVLEVDRDAII